MIKMSESEKTKELDNNLRKAIEDNVRIVISALRRNDLGYEGIDKLFTYRIRYLLGLKFNYDFITGLRKEEVIGDLERDSVIEELKRMKERDFHTNYFSDIFYALDVLYGMDAISKIEYINLLNLCGAIMAYFTPKIDSDEEKIRVGNIYYFLDKLMKREGSD